MSKSSQNNNKVKKLMKPYQYLLLAYQRKAKDHLGYSIRSFSAELGLDSGTVSRYLSGQRKITKEAGIKMSAGLRLEKNEIFDFLASLEAPSFSEGAATPNKRAKKEGGEKLKKHLEKIDIAGLKEDGQSAIAWKEGPEQERRVQIDKAIRRLRRGEVTAEDAAVLNPRQEKIKEAYRVVDRVVQKNFKEKKLFITTAIQGADVHREFLASIETFLKEENAEMIILTTKAHLAPLREDTFPLDEIIHDRHNDSIYSRVELNRYLTALDHDRRPYRSDPLSGLAELGAADGRSYIIAHPQQRMKTYPNKMRSIGRIQQCTGAVTYPSYRNNDSGYLGDYRHIIGGLVVEIAADRFHIRTVQASEDGSFIDLGKRYCPNGYVVAGENERAEALIRGDDHGGPDVFGDEKVNEALAEITDVTRPKRIFLHDIFDAATISHHNEKNMHARNLVSKNLTSLEAELSLTKKFLDSLYASKPADAELFVVYSNHNEHLHKLLSEPQRWGQYPGNFETILRLANLWYNEGKDPLQHSLDPGANKAKWLSWDDEVIVCDYFLSSHGHLGLNGMKGSVKSDLISFGKSISGHSHGPEIYRDAIRVGTSSRRYMNYNKGPSSWAHCSALLYKGGLKQLVIIIDGKWRLGELSMPKKPRPAGRIEAGKNGGSRKKRAAASEKGKPSKKMDGDKK